MDAQFSKFLQIGIIVRDAHAAAECWEKKFGIGPWTYGGVDSDAIPQLEIVGEPGKKIKTINAFCNCWGFELELIQPVSESPYKTWLDEHGPGIHHIAVITKDNFEKVISDYKEMTGKEPWIHCISKPIGMNFAYLDLTEQLGVFTEIYDEDKKGGIPADFHLPE